MQTLQFFLFLFLGFITLIRKAQQRTYFNKLDFPSTFLGLLPHEENGLSNLKDSVEEGNINRVVTILQNNIKQWSFIEAQLLEPNVNLGMPEIFIPLKHLTTTLEILGNIFFMKNELSEAKQCLERACPLLELLPLSVMEQPGNDRDGASFMKKNSNNYNENNNQNPQNYAADCFSVLRKIYLKMYGDKTSLDSALPEPPDEDQQYDAQDQFSSEEEFDVDSKIEELRQPFQHLRSELMPVQDQGDYDNENEFIDNSHKKNSDRDRDFESVNSGGGSATPQSVSSSKFRDIFLNGLHGYSRTGSTADQPGPLSNSAQLAGSREAHLLGLGGSATSLIAADMEIMLRKFVKEDDAGRRELFEVARKYYEDLDMNFPSMDLHEYAANMELGTVYLEVMARVVYEGFAFIAPELERWQEFGQTLMLRGNNGGSPSGSNRPNMVPSVDFVPSVSVDTPHMSALNDPKAASSSSNHRFGVGIIWEIDPDTGVKKEFAVELDGTYFDSFSLQERNRLLVLSAFDIALNLEPDEHFDLSLGFSLGVLDNDKTRHRDAYFHPYSHHDGIGSSNQGQEDSFRGSGSNGRSASSKRRPRSKSTPILDSDATAALFEDETLSSIGITSAMRSSVPTLKAEDDWTLHLFLAFMIATVLIVYLSYSESRKKQRSRQAHRMGSNGSTGSGSNAIYGNRRHSNPDGFLGLFIRYLYPQYFDTDTSSNATTEPPMDTWAFLTELSTLIVQLDFIQWVISLFVHADSSSASTASTSNAKASTKKSVSSVNKQQSNAPSSSTGFWQSIVQQFLGSSSATTSSATNIHPTHSSTSGTATATHHKANNNPNNNNNTSTSTSSASQHHTSKAKTSTSASVAEKSMAQTPSHTTTSTVATTSPESSNDSSTDDNFSAIYSSANGTSTRGKASTNSKAGAKSTKSSSVPSSTSNTYATPTNTTYKDSNSTPNANSSNLYSGGWSGSDRDDGFFSAYGVSASEDEGWQAAGNINKRSKATAQSNATNSTSGNSGRKSLDGQQQQKSTVATPLTATTTKPTSTPSSAATTSKPVASTSTTPSAPSLLTQKLRSSPATEPWSANKQPKTMSDETVSVEAMKNLPPSANSMSSAAAVSYAKRVSGATTSTTSTTTTSSTSNTGPSYKHAVVTKKDAANSTTPNNTTSTNSATTNPWKPNTNSLSTTSEPLSVPQTSTTPSSTIYGGSTTSMSSDLFQRTHGVASTEASPPQQQQQQQQPASPYVASRASLAPSMLYSPSDNHASSVTSTSSGGLFGHMFGPSTPSFLLSGPTNHTQPSLTSFHTSLGHQHHGTTTSSSSTSSLLFPSMSTTGTTSFLFHDNTTGGDGTTAGSELNLASFLSDPPLDAFATASSSPAKPSSLLSQAPPPGLDRITRAPSSHNAGPMTTSSATGFDLLYPRPSNGKATTSSATGSALFSGLAVVDSNVSSSTTGSKVMTGVPPTGVEDEGYGVSNFLSNMLDDFLQPNSPTPDLFGAHQRLPSHATTTSSSSSFGYVATSDSTIVTSSGAQGGPLESDLSADAPVFLPSSMFQSTPDHGMMAAENVFNPFSFLNNSTNTSSSLNMSVPTMWADQVSGDDQQRESF